MNGVLIFDHLNDVIYAKYNKKFSKHLINIAVTQNLVKEKTEHEEDYEINSNVIMQIFSPIVTSQRIMSCQFGNSYTSIQCQDGLNIVFSEYMGYLFMQIGNQSVAFLARSIGICVSMVRHICGADVSLLKSNKERAYLLGRLLDTWICLRNNDQAVLVEAVEQLMVNSDLGSATLKALQEVTDKLKNQPDVSRVHAMVLVRNKFMSLYSSRNAHELSPSDIIFLSLLSMLSLKSDESDEKLETSDTPIPSPTNSTHSEENYTEKDLTSHLILLMGNAALPQCLPHMVHILPLSDDVRLLIILEIGNSIIASGLFEAFHYLNIMQTVQMQKDSDALRPAFDDIDNAIKKVLDAFKKSKNLPTELDSLYKIFLSKWEMIRKKYMELLKTGDADCVIRIESNTAGLIDSMKDLLHHTVFDTDAYTQNPERIVELSGHVQKKLASFSDFLKVKALRNFTLGSRASLTINKYLEEFPGLVHFLYIDRTNHRVTAPSLDFTSEETVSLTKRKIWTMIEFAHSHLQEGHLAFMWKDTTFNYSYFIWFEDSNGSPLKPKVYPSNSIKTLPLPGILAVDFYKKLIELCFPKQTPNKIRCYELFCIHLGLATSSCVLEHTRRLAATIWDVTGVPTNPIDLL